MSQIKTNNNLKQRAATVLEQFGLALMTIATIAGLVEIHDRPLRNAVVAPAFVIAGQGSDINPVRREREETGPHYVSYSAIQRTPGRTGKY